jgi:hypothetical protein
VPSTSPLASLTISFRRAEMTAFWILTTAIVSVALGLASAAFGGRAPWAWGAAGLSLLLPGLVWPQWFEFGIRVWNKSVRLTAAVLRKYVLKVVYYVLFGAVSRTGSSLDLELRATEVSRWIPRAEDYSAFHDDPSLGTREERAHGLNTLPRRPGQAWRVCLQPALLLLKLLRDEAQESVPSSSTYTLY